MKIVKEDLWKPAIMTLIVVTTNATIKNNGRLVMGRGAAREARNRIKDIDLRCGYAINRKSLYGFMEILDPRREGKCGFGIFQVKKIYNDAAELSIIEYSANKLASWAEKNLEVSVRINFPGIGAGRLEYKDVLPVLEKANIPDNVIFCLK